MFVASDFKVAWLWAHIELFVRACLNSSCSYTGDIWRFLCAGKLDCHWENWLL